MQLNKMTIVFSWMELKIANIKYQIKSVLFPKKAAGYRLFIISN